MKYFTTFLLVFFALHSFAQSHQDTITIDDDYTRIRSKPVVLHDGTIVLVKTDSIYLINGVRYRFYESLRSLLNDSIDFKMERLILTYEKSLMESDRIFKGLLKNCTENYAITESILKQTKTSLAATQATLELSQESLLAANSSLEDANEKLRKIKGNNLLNSILIGAGGVGAGLLIGALVFH